jgi:branched-chain amino acid transport system ATP-binding protein
VTNLLARSRRGGADARNEPATLQVEDFYAGYGRIPVLRGIGLTVAPGESVALLGANGAGKTTFLRAISGLLKPSGGTVTYGGADLTMANPQRVLQAGIAHVPQGRQVFASMTVRENLLLGSRLRSDTQQVSEDLAYLLEVFPALREKMKQNAGDLSGGQQQALAVARGLMSGPSLLLLDEPSLGLSPRLVDDLGELLRKVQKDRKMGMLLVEQDTLLALELTERAYVIQRGEIVLERESRTLTDDPSVVFAYLGGEDTIVATVADAPAHTPGASPEQDHGNAG